MAKIVSTSGVVSKFTTSALMGLGATSTDANGRFYLDGSAVHAELSRVIAESIYIKRVFRDGQSVTGKYTSDNQRGGAVRVILNTPLPFSSRTTSYGGRPGTNGNAGVINTNGPDLPANDEFMVYLNQVNDQMMAFPELSKEYLPLDVAASRIAQYADRVSMDRDASTLAEIIAYNFYRAQNGADNLVDHGNLADENAYANLINDLNARLANGDIERGAFTFPTEGRTIIGRPRFINGIFNRNSGVIMLGGDLAQEMLKNYDLDVRMADRDYVGTGYKGFAMGFHYQEAPDYIWNLAEAYLGLRKGALDNVNAIAVSFDATAVADGVDLGVKVVDATEFRGSLAQPLNVWGHEAFRLSYIIGNDTLTVDAIAALGFSAEKRSYPVAPTKAAAALLMGNGMGVNYISVPIYDDQNNVVGFRQIASVPKPNGNNIQSGVAQVLDVQASVLPGAVASGTAVTLSTATPGATIYYTTDGTTPTVNSSEYSTEIAITAKTTIKAFAVKDGNVASNVSAFDYTIK